MSSSMPSRTESKSIPPSVFAVLRTYLEARATFSEGDFDRVEAAFLFRHIEADKFLQRAGDIPRYAVFVANGCLRNYVIDGKGKEHIVQFAPETWWLADSVNIIAQTPSPYFIDAIEDSDLLLIDGPSHQGLLEHVPSYARAFSTGVQRHNSAKDQRIVSNLSASAEERYHEFLRIYPSIAVRVPQSMLASYLGITPETVSRIRKKLSRK
jgi:CRP-like cAMP-binding protein